MFIIKDNATFNLLCKNTARKIHEKSKGKLSIKACFLASCIAESLPNTPDGFNINTLKSQLSESSDSDVLTDPNEVAFNKKSLELIIQLISDKEILAILLNGMILTVRRETEDNLFDLVNELGQTDDLLHKILEGTEKDLEYHNIYTRMYGDDLSGYLESAFETTPFEHGISHKEFTLKIGKRVLWHCTGDMLFECLNKLTIELLSDNEKGKIAAKIEEIINTDTFSIENESDNLRCLAIEFINKHFQPISFN